MHSLRYLTVAFCVLCLLNVICAKCPATSGYTPGSKYTIQLSTDSGIRESKVVIPDSYQKNVSRPLFVVLHPLNVNNEIMESLTGFDAIAEEENVIVTYPQGLNNSWNGGSCCPSSWYLGENVEDVQFIDALLDQLTTNLCIDEDNIFVTGYSNGGFLSFRLMCELTSRFRAAGTVAAVTAQYIPTETIFSCPKSANIPLLHFHGTEDHAVPFKGNPALKWPSVPQNMEDWASINGCDTEKTTTTFQNGTYTCIGYSCPASANVTFCTGDGEGHIWPGKMETTDIDATVEITNFFRTFYNPSMISDENTHISATTYNKKNIS